MCCCSQVWAWTGYVLQVEDGNTIKVSKQPQGQGEQVLVRLYGIDAPVLSQPYAREAQYFLHKLLPRDAMINVEETGEEKDGSLTALVQVDGSSVNYQLIVDGLAWVNRTTCKALFCRRWYIQEHRALKQGKGLWGLKLATPPWQWSR
ncbi:MAG: thermonuclease family protein [Desulfovibrionaceae bacterium]|nr:thermonuclease family protein [Desulfovibrionaceae bacterium]